MKPRPALARRYLSQRLELVCCAEEATVEALAKEAGLSITDAWSDRVSTARMEELWV
jgi:hypothetical protein